MSLMRKSKIVVVGTGETTLLTAGAGENIIVVSLIFGNVDGTNDATVDVLIKKSGETVTTPVAKVLLVKAGEALQFFVGGKDGLFLEAGDVFGAKGSVAGRINSLVSYIVES